jgi:uncharacterized protein GlcG (DUF336 family)
MDDKRNADGNVVAVERENGALWLRVEDTTHGNYAAVRLTAEEADALALKLYQLAHGTTGVAQH